MKYQVFLISDAEYDILDIYQFIKINDSAQKADYVFKKIRENCDRLSHFPARGHTPPELERIGILNYREIHFKPYRIIYEIIKGKVFVHCILDGRRSLQELLQRRLIR